MLTQLDLMRGATGAYVVVVPAKLPEGLLIMKVGPQVVELHSQMSGCLARVGRVHEEVSKALGQLDKIALLEVEDGAPVPTTIKHWATIEKVDL